MKYTTKDTKQIVNEINHVISLNNDIQNIKKLYEKTEQEILNCYTDTVDKYGRQFVKGGSGKFTACDAMSIEFESWKGYFGSSDCYKQLSIQNPDTFWECFIQWLNIHQKEVMLGVANLMQKRLTDSQSTMQEFVDMINNVLDTTKSIE